MARPPSLRVPLNAAPFPVLSKAAFARWLGCKAPQVSQWIKEGVLASPALQDDGRIDAAAAIIALKAAGAFVPLEDDAPQIARVIQAASLVSFDEAKAFNEVLRAHRATLDLRERHGELVRRDIADGLLFDAGREYRDSLLNWPPRIAAEMAAELGIAPARMLAALERRVREFLVELSDPKADWRGRAAEARRDAA